MASTPEDKGPSSARVAAFNMSNPIHVGIMKNRENNPNVTMRFEPKQGRRVIKMPVAPGMEAEPKLSTRYPSHDTETVPYKYEGPEPTYGAKEEAKPAAKPAAKPTARPTVRPVAKKAVPAKPAPKKVSNLEKARQREAEARSKGVI